MSVYFVRKKRFVLTLTTAQLMGQSEQAERTSEEQSASERAALEDLPPSAKLVVTVLEHDGKLSQQELAEETMLPPRTVRYALGRLREANVVEAQFSFADARKRRYALVESSE